MTPFWVTIWTIVASLLSGMIGVIVSSWRYQEFDKLKQKRDTLRRLLGNRWAITEGLERDYEHFRGECFAALNEVFVVFHDSDPVIDALKKYHESMSPDNRLRLFKAMCKDSKVSHEFNDSFFEKPFTPGSPFRGTGSV